MQRAQGAGLGSGSQKPPEALCRAQSSSASSHTQRLLTSRHWNLLLLQLKWLHFCPGHAKESQEHGQEAKLVAPQPGGGLQPQHGPVGHSGRSPAQLSSSLPGLDGAIHNLKESGWAGRQKGAAGE